MRRFTHAHPCDAQASLDMNGGGFVLFDEFCSVRPPQHRSTRT